MRTRIAVPNGIDLGKRSRKFGYVGFSALNERYFIVHYPQKFTPLVLQYLKDTDHIICCYPARFIKDYPEFKDKVIGNWLAVTMVRFDEREIIVREIRKKPSKNKMVILTMGYKTEVLDEDTYHKRFADGTESFNGEIKYLHQNDEHRLKKRGRFESFLNVFTEEENYILVSWHGETNKITVPIDERVAMMRVKNSFIGSGLTFEEFIRALDRLHKNGDV